MTFTQRIPASAAPSAAGRRAQEFGRAGSEREPLPFSAPSLAPPRAATATARSPSRKPRRLRAPTSPSVDDRSARAAAAAPEPQPFRGDWASAPLDDLGLVQLVQRLGASLERRREWLASGAVAAPAPRSRRRGFDPAPAEEAAQAMAAYFGNRRSAADEVGDERRRRLRLLRQAPPEPARLVAGGRRRRRRRDAVVHPAAAQAVAPTIAFDGRAAERDDDEDAAREPTTATARCWHAQSVRPKDDASSASRSPKPRTTRRAGGGVSRPRNRVRSATAGQRHARSIRRPAPSDGARDRSSGRRRRRAARRAGDAPADERNRLTQNCALRLRTQLCGADRRNLPKVFPVAMGKPRDIFEATREWVIRAPLPHCAGAGAGLDPPRQERELDRVPRPAGPVRSAQRA